MKTVSIVSLALNAALVVYLIQTRITNQMLRDHLSLQHSARLLLEDQVGELTYTLREKSLEQQGARTEGFVAGALSALNNPEHYDRIWHDGYDHGFSTVTQMQEVNAVSH